MGPAGILQFLRENFIAISGLAVVGGIGLSTIFLSAYLSVFDWHLLWFVQYADILTFGLIAIGIIGGSFLFLQTAAQTLIGVFSFYSEIKRWWFIGLGGLFVLAIVGFDVWGSIHQGEGYFHVLFGVLAIALGIVLILLFVAHVKSGKWPNAIQVTFTMILVITSTVCFGEWLAYSVLETSQFDQDVKFKNGILNDAKLVIVMTRHSIFQKDGVLYAISTADIEQLRMKGKH